MLKPPSAVLRFGGVFVDVFWIAIILILLGVYGLFTYNSPRHQYNHLYSKWQDLFGDKAMKIFMFVFSVISIVVGIVFLIKSFWA